MSKPPHGEELDIADFATGREASTRATRLCLETITGIDAAGPCLRAMIAVNPAAKAQAGQRDAEREAGAARGPLHGAPIVVKDNIETIEALATTAGSLALRDNVTGRDAPAIARIRAAGAVILGKANLSEWANFRSAHSLSGWSAMGGQCRNAIDPARSPCGSSSGSAVAVAAGMAWAAIGTETDGSITCPAAVNGVVGFKPTLGLVPRAGIVPITRHQDTAGPITRTVGDAAIVLDAMAGTDCAAGLEAVSLPRFRLGVMRFATGFHPATDAVFEAAIATLAKAGAILVDIAEGPDVKAMEEAEMLALTSEFKGELEAYLATTPDEVAVRTLADLIAFNRAHAEREMPLFGQDLLRAALEAKGVEDADYLAARETAGRLAGPEGIDRLLREHDVEILIAPTMGPAWLIDELVKDHYIGGPATMLAAVAGCPHLTAPMGKVGTMPVGLSVIGSAGGDRRVLAAGSAIERAMNAALR